MTGFVGGVLNLAVWVLQHATPAEQPIPASVLDRLGVATFVVLVVCAALILPAHWLIDRAAAEPELSPTADG